MKQQTRLDRKLDRVTCPICDGPTKRTPEEPVVECTVVTYSLRCIRCGQQLTHVRRRPGNGRSAPPLGDAGQ